MITNGTIIILLLLIILSILYTLVVGTVGYCCYCLRVSRLLVCLFVDFRSFCKCDPFTWQRKHFLFFRFPIL